MSINKEIFKIEFSRRFKNTGLSVSMAENGKDLVLSGKKTLKALRIRTELPGVDADAFTHLREPAPFYNAEAVLFYKFTLYDSPYPPDYVVFIFENQVRKKTYFLIFKAVVLKECLEKVPVKPDKSGYFNLLLWIFRNDFVFVANNLSGEGEWYLLGGLDNDVGSSDCMAKGDERDWSEHMNRWNIFDEVMGI
jgi:hypothetical protein